MKPEQIDKIVCEWSMAYGIAMPEKALNTLVDTLSLAAAPKLDSKDLSAENERLRGAIKLSIARSDDYGDSFCSQPIREVLKAKQS